MPIVKRRLAAASRLVRPSVRKTKRRFQKREAHRGTRTTNPSLRVKERRRSLSREVSECRAATPKASTSYERQRRRGNILCVRGVRVAIRVETHVKL
jgi:hypothetical protein